MADGSIGMTQEIARILWALDSARAALRHGGSQEEVDGLLSDLDRLLRTSPLVVAAGLEGVFG